jgi:hypothetical protein
MILARIKNIFTTSVLLLCVTLIVAAVPIGSMGVKHAYAIPVEVVADSGWPTDTFNAGRSAISAVSDTASAGSAGWLVFKNEILDQIFWQLANIMIQNLIKSTTQWVANGFEGNPAFVTDLEGFLTDVADQAAGEYIKGTRLGFLCSPFKLDIRIALSIEYFDAGKSAPNCSLTGITNNLENFYDGTFSEGGWAGWFELTQGTHNDPNRAYLETKAEMSDLILRTKDRELTLLKGNDFFFNVEVCETGISFNGSIKDCKTTTPGNVVQEQLNHTLKLGPNRLVVAKEFNELVNALLAQVAHQALAGAGGLLGLGGAPKYESATYGASGRSTYFEAIEEATVVELSQSENPIVEAIDEQNRYVSLQNGIISLIEITELQYGTAKSDYPTCFDINLPTGLSNIQNNARADIVQTELVTDELFILNRQWVSATDPDQRLDVLVAFSELKASGRAVTEIDTAEVDILLDLTIAPLLSTARSDLSDERARCKEEVGNSGSRDPGDSDNGE